ncbi:hypothetical protein C8R44DRAFT_887064 [Mycena epipterygia]|nr:hypothetical protein C8R44DRAFT_887064 [Mycena epipterygia]
MRCGPGLRIPNVKNADDVSPMSSLDPMSGFDLNRIPTLGDTSPSYRPYCRPTRSPIRATTAAPPNSQCRLKALPSPHSFPHQTASSALPSTFHPLAKSLTWPKPKSPHSHDSLALTSSLNTRTLATRPDDTSSTVLLDIRQQRDQHRPHSPTPGEPGGLLRFPTSSLFPSFLVCPSPSPSLVLISLPPSSSSPPRLLPLPPRISPLSSLFVSLPPHLSSLCPRLSLPSLLVTPPPSPCLPRPVPRQVE